jgi:hypothetical protein
VNKYRDQAADERLRFIERIESCLDVAEALDTAGADVGAMRHNAERVLARALGTTVPAAVAPTMPDARMVPATVRPVVIVDEWHDDDGTPRREVSHEVASIPARPWRTAPVQGPRQATSGQRTTALPARAVTENGAVPVHRTMGRGTEADAYPMLDGAPVGRPESLDAHEAEAEAEASARYWDAAATARAEAAEMSPAAKRRARRAKQAASRSPLAALAALNAALGAK